MPTTTTAPNAGKHATFKFFTAAVKAYVQKDASGGDQYYIEGIASSNVRDRSGDTITAQAQAQMLEQAKGLAMFLNHDYDVPEDVAGECSESSLETNGDVIQLAIRLRIAQSNDRAMKSWRLVHDDKIRLGFSIGGSITEAEIDDENDEGMSWFPPLIINGIELYEISLVGIPANPRAYTRSFVEDIARSSIKGATRADVVKGALLKQLGIKSLDEHPTTDAVVTCAHVAGCTAPKADDSLLCAAHRDAAKIADSNTSGELKTGIFLEVGEASTVVLQRNGVAVRSVHLDEPVDVVPANAMTLAVPEGFDVDAFRKSWDEAIANGDSPVVTTDTARSAEVSLKQGERSITVTAHGLDAADVVASIRAQLETGNETVLEQQVSARDALVTEIATLTSERDAVKNESAEMLKTLAELKATPTGRQTKTATPGGSSGNRTAILGVDPSTLTAEELRALHQRIARGELATDGREHAQQ